MKPRVGEWLTIAGLVLGAVIWAVRLEGRVDAQEKEFQTVVSQLRDDIHYIRDRVDRAVAVKP